MGIPGYVTIDLVREELQDRLPGDNSIDCDQFFSDDDIFHAMDRAAAAYNSLPPLGIDVVSARCLPTDTNIFLDAVLSRLYSAAIHKLSRNLVTWSAGGVTVDLEKTRLEAFRQLKAAQENDWREAGKQRKMERNRGLAWGNF